MKKVHLINELEVIVRNSGDDTLNVEGFFNKCISSINNMGVEETSRVYDIEVGYLKKLEVYMRENDL